MSQDEQTRCRPGYDPVHGRPQHSQGSCRKKAESRLTPAETAFLSRRQRQLDNWQKKHPGAARSAAQHLSKPMP